MSNASKAATKYHVGQTVHIGSVNRHGTGEGTVVKVGRALVTVQYGHGYQKVFRIETGVANDNYGHEWIETDEERQEREERQDLTQRLHRAGLRLDFGVVIPTGQLRRIVEAAE